MKLSTRYINDRFLPDKAIDLMDEAASRVRMEQEELLQELKSLEEKINALRQDKDAAIAHRTLRRPPSCGTSRRTTRSRWRSSVTSAAEAICSTGTSTRRTSPLWWLAGPASRHPSDRGREPALAAHGGYPS